MGLPRAAGTASSRRLSCSTISPGTPWRHPQAFLGDYHGLLMSDGYDAWRTLDGAIHLGCMAHARPGQFTDALEGEKETRWSSAAGAQVLRGPGRGRETGTAKRRAKAKHAPITPYVCDSSAQPAGIGRLQDMARRSGAEGPLPESFTGKAITPMRKTNGTI